MTVESLPAINAVFNGLSTVLITAGFVLIKRGRKQAHRACMLAAAVSSACFLVGYLTHKVLVHGANALFGGHGAIRPVYFTMLISHVILAMAIVYLVPRTFLFALQGRFDRHKAWARWVFPIWYYVSVTGVLIYFFLYQWWPSGRYAIGM